MGIAAAIYARLSVDRDGTKVGIDTQLEDSRKLAQQHGWDVVHEYVDRNLTAADKLVKRPEYDQLVADFEMGRFSALICWDLDRLTRQPRQLEDWIDAAEDRGLRIVTANGEADLGTDGGRMYARIKAAVAKGEAERASARQKRNKQHRRENGLWHGGIPPYGYKAVEGQLVPEETEVARIHEVARRMLDDREAMHSIVTDWNNRGIQTRLGKHWRQANLRSIMLNRSMLGETMPGVKAQWKPIIDQRTFDRMHALLTDPSRKVVHSPGVKGGKYSMGGGLTVCGACGKPLITHGKQSAKVKTTTLACLARVHGPSDKHPRVLRTRGGKESWEDTGRVSIVHDALEEVVWEELIGKLKETPRFMQRMSEQDPETDDRLDELEQERRDLRAQKERAQKAYVLGIMDERDSVAEVTRIDALIDAIGKEYDSLLRLPISMIDFDPEKGIDWRSWTPGRRRAALRGFIDKIEVHPYPPGTARTRPRLKNESEDEYLAAKWEILKLATAARINVNWKWEKSIK
ncbi:MAG TPA: recombinase family protein [Microbacteriaceae bacterium]|nr:recombinase family protein [Microbacteriaceae bacterium]